MAETVRAGRGRLRMLDLAGLTVGLGGLAIGLTGCDTGSLFRSPDTAGTTSGSRTTSVQQQLPAGVGKGLKYAVDLARAAGFTQYVTHDASGRMRAQIIYTDWKVCFQTPDPGVLPTTTRVDFGVVKLAESCPAADQGLVTVTAGAVMPDLRRRSTRYAHDVLGGDASISYKTRSGGDAHVLIDSNWEVCDQTPAPGRPYGGVPVTLVVTKYIDGGCQEP
jgi:hypothetical protein